MSHSGSSHGETESGTNAEVPRLRYTAALGGYPPTHSGCGMDLSKRGFTSTSVKPQLRSRSLSYVVRRYKVSHSGL